MKIKDTLDLCGWGLHNFCIQNHDDLETLQNLGLGRKIFYTGNSNDKHHREVIYDGSTWRISAYMSDVDELRGLITALESATDEEIEALKGRATTLEGRATTTEGNLSALKERVDAFLDGGVDSDAVLENLKEIQAFLDAYDGATSLAEILDTKFDKAGGTIESPIVVNSEYNYAITNNATGNWTGIRYRIADTTKGYIGINEQGKPILVDANQAQIKFFLHEGNYVDLIGNTYLKTTGGVIEGNADAFVVRRNANGASWITFENRDSEGVAKRIGFLGMSSPDVPSFMNGAANRVVKLLHEDNYSDLITTLNGNLSVAGAVNVGTGGLSVEGITSLKNRVLIKGVNDDGSSALSLAGALKVCRNTSSKDTFLEVTSGDTIVKYMGHDSLDGFCSHDFYSHDKLLLHISATNATSQFYTMLAASGLISANGGLYIPTGQTLTIGEATISWDEENNALKVDKNIYSDGEVSAGGAATEGEGGAGGFSLYESWGTSAPTEPLALGANLGYELKTRVEDLELAKTKVEISDTLVSGKPIGAITIDGNKTNLFAPATYAWSEITSKPTTLAGYGITDALSTAGGTISGNILMAEGNHVVTRELYAAKDATYDLGGNSRRWSNVHTVLINGGTPIHSGNYSNYALPLTGGRINGAGANLLIVDCTDGSSYIRFDSEGQYLGRIGFTVDYKPIVHLIDNNTYEIFTSAGGTMTGRLNIQGDGTAWIGFKSSTQHFGNIGVNETGPKFWDGASSHSILHSGNVGEYNAGGIASGVATDDYLQGRVAKAWYDWNANTGNGADNYSYGIYVGAYDTGYGMQLATTISSQSFLRTRVKRNSAWEAWKTIAFTDSDITGNAATATKLKGNTAYTAWGQTFFENGTPKNVMGSLAFNATQKISWHGDANNFYITSDSFSEGLDPSIIYRGYGGHVFKTNSSTTRLLINPSGNVTIGASDLAGTFVKLHVDGNVRIGAEDASDTTQRYLYFWKGDGIYAHRGLLGVNENGIFYNYWNSTTGAHAGLRLGADGLEYKRNQSSSAFFINPSGNVTIGAIAYTSDSSTRLFVDGLTRITGLGTYSLGSTPTAGLVIHAYNNTYGVAHWIENSGQGFIQVGRYDGDTDAYALNLNPLGGAVNIASANALTNVLGTMKVAGLANFSSRVLIGAVTDNGTSALQVKGAIKAYSSANDLKFYTRINGASVQVGRTSSAYTDGYNCGLQLGEDNTNIGYIAGAYNDKVLNETNYFYGGKDASSSPFVISIHDDITYLRSSRTIISSSLEVNGTSFFGGQSTFNAFALFNKPIVAKDTLQIGDAVLMWDGNKKALIVDKSFASMGEISAGGAGTEGGNTGGGGTGTITNPDVEYYNPKNNATHTFYHNLPYYDVVVQVYEKNAISGAWDMILADVTIANESNLITVNFGRKEDVEHKIVVR